LPELWRQLFPLQRGLRPQRLLLLLLAESLVEVAVMVEVEVKEAAGVFLGEVAVKEAEGESLVAEVVTLLVLQQQQQVEVLP